MPNRRPLRTSDILPIPPRFRKANWYLILAFFVWAFILYGNTILNRYLADDKCVTDNETVRQGVMAIPEIFATRCPEQSGCRPDGLPGYHPLVRLTFALEYQLYNQAGAGFSHAVNLLLYFFLSVLLFFLLKRMLKNHNILFLFLITILFMAHPVHTEVVASLKNRGELLAFLCGLGTLYLLLEYADTGKHRYILPALMVFLTGCLCGTSILPFLLICPLTFYFFTDLKPGKYLPVAGILAVLAILSQAGPEWFLPAGERFTGISENPLVAEKSLTYRIGTSLSSLFFYTRILIYPYPLLFYYGYDMVPLITPTHIRSLISLLLLTGLLVYALRRFMEKQLISFAILWYLVFVFMYSNLLVTIPGIVGERFVFAASLGFCIALVWAIFKLFHTEPNSLTIEFDARVQILAVTLLILIPYTAITVKRNREWKDTGTLYTHDIPYLKNSANANARYARYLMQEAFRDPYFREQGAVDQHRLGIIRAHLLRSLDICPDDYRVLNDLGTVCFLLGNDPDSAIHFLTRATGLDPRPDSAWVLLGMAYQETGKLDSAARCFEEVNRREIRYDMCMKLSDLYSLQGDTLRAAVYRQKAAVLTGGRD